MRKGTLAYSLATFAILGLAYPPTNLAVERESIADWLGTHVAMCLIMTAMALAFDWASGKIFRRAWIRAAVTALLTLVGLASWALTLGNVSAQMLEVLPLERVHGEFFRNFYSIVFALVVAPCAAALTPLLMRRIERPRT